MAEAREYLSARDLAALRLPGLPTDYGSIIARATREAWPHRKRAGRGGGREYHVASLPTAVRAALATREAQRAAGVVALPTATTPDSERIRAAGPKAQARLDRALFALNYFESCLDHGMTRGAAIDATCAACAPRVSAGTVERWLRVTRGRPRTEWLGLLLPRWTPGRDAAFTTGEEAFYEAWRARLVDMPTQSHQEAHRRVAEALGPGADVPSLARVARRWKSEPAVARHLAVRGVDVFRRQLTPHPKRTLETVRAYEILNVDGFDLPWVTRLPDGTQKRLTLIAFQDVKTRALVQARLDLHETANAVVQCLAEMVLRLGKPTEIRSDNGHAFSADRVAGGEPGRRRFGAATRSLVGIVPRLHMKWGWAIPKNAGAKPVERAFGTLNTYFEADPRLAGAFLGRTIRLRPHTYAGRVVELEATKAIVRDALDAYNTRDGRRGGEAAGRSYLADFVEQYAVRQAAGEIPSATADERELFWVEHLPVVVRKNCTIVVRGATYYATALLDLMGEKVVARVAPDELATPTVRVERLDGRVVGYATLVGDVGFRDRDAARAVTQRQRAIEREGRLAIRAWVEAGAIRTAAMAGSEFTAIALPAPAPREDRAGPAVDPVPARRGFLSRDADVEESPAERLFNQMLIRPPHAAEA